MTKQYKYDIINMYFLILHTKEEKMRKYNDFLTYFLIGVIILVIIGIIFLGFNYYRNYYINKDARRCSR